MVIKRRDGYGNRVFGKDVTTLLASVGHLDTIIAAKRVVLPIIRFRAADKIFEIPVDLLRNASFGIVLA